jgi:hypothetical protein
VKYHEEFEMRKYLAIAAITFSLASHGCMSSQNTPPAEIKPQAYAGHENDRDISNFIRQYPTAAGTRLDDCQTCHRSGIAGTDTEREFSPCGYCHLIEFPNPRYSTGVPDSFEATLNSFGLDYKRNGRSAEAFISIAGLDSDRDGFPNGKEISEIRYPGDSSSRPGQPLSPAITLEWEDIQSLPHHTQFMLMNRTTQQFDAYTTYSGIRVRDVLSAAEVDLNDVVGITVFAPDGYSIDYGIDEVLEPFPKGYYYDAPGAIEDTEKRLVEYPETIPEGVAGNGEIPDELWLLLAFEQNGEPLEISHYEKGSGKLVGEGPYRLIKPQADLMGDVSKPGRPDRSIKSETYGDGWDYDEKIDHNAGNCVRGATVIRLNPMPEGFEQYDWKNGWPLIESRQVVIFGQGVEDKK